MGKKSRYIEKRTIPEMSLRANSEFTPEKKIIKYFVLYYY